jgi:hypothetical protein
MVKKYFDIFRNLMTTWFLPYQIQLSTLYPEVRNSSLICEKIIQEVYKAPSDSFFCIKMVIAQLRVEAKSQI